MTHNCRPGRVGRQVRLPASDTSALPLPAVILECQSYTLTLNVWETLVHNFWSVVHFRVLEKQSRLDSILVLCMYKLPTIRAHPLIYRQVLSVHVDGTTLPTTHFKGAPLVLKLTAQIALLGSATDRLRHYKLQSTTILLKTADDQSQAVIVVTLLQMSF